jgi:hypothetical protein
VYNDATLTNDAESTGCVFNSDLRGELLIDYMFKRGMAMIGTFAIAGGYTCLACWIQWNRETKPDLGQISRFQTVSNSFLSGFSFASELFLIFGMFSQVQELAITMTVFRLFHFILGMMFMAVMFIVPFESFAKLEGVTFSSSVITSIDSLIEVYDYQFTRKSASSVGAILLLSFTDFSMIQFLPWKNSLFFKESHGYPSLPTMKIATLTKVVQSTASAICQIIYLLADGNIDDPTMLPQAKALFVMNIASSILKVVMAVILISIKSKALGVLHTAHCEEKMRKSQINDAEALAAARESMALELSEYRTHPSTPTTKNSNGDGNGNDSGNDNDNDSVDKQYVFSNPMHDVDVAREQIDVDVVPSATEDSNEHHGSNIEEKIAIDPIDEVQL